MVISMRKIDELKIDELINGKDLIHTPESSLLVLLIVAVISNVPIIFVSLFVSGSTVQISAVHLVNLLPSPKYLIPIQWSELFLLNMSNMAITSPNISDFDDSTL